MGPLKPPLLPLSTFAILLSFGIHGGHAAEPPDNVADALKEAGQYCKDLGGTPNTDEVLGVDDVNKDGGEDWLVDYAKMKCEGADNPLCGTGGCTLQLYFWDGATSWDLVFEDLVQKYKFGKKNGKPTMTVTTSGDPCNKPSAQTCTYVYRLEHDEVVPVE